MSSDDSALPIVRTRVTFFLPVTDQQEQKAILGVVRYLTDQVQRRVSVDGFTRSRIPDTSFSGHWFDATTKKWLPPEVVSFFIVDYAYRHDDPEFQKALGRLGSRIAEEYHDNGKPQKEIWITAHSILLFKYATADGSE